MVPIGRLKIVKYRIYHRPTKDGRPYRGLGYQSVEQRSCSPLPVEQPAGRGSLMEYEKGRTIHDGSGDRRSRDVGVVWVSWSGGHGKED